MEPESEINPVEESTHTITTIYIQRLNLALNELSSMEVRQIGENLD